MIPGQMGVWDGLGAGDRIADREPGLGVVGIVQRRQSGAGSGQERRLDWRISGSKKLFISRAVRFIRRRRWHDVNRYNRTDSDPAHCNAKEYQHAGEPVPEQCGFPSLLPPMSDGSRTRPIPPPG